MAGSGNGQQGCQFASRRGPTAYQAMQDNLRAQGMPDQANGRVGGAVLIAVAILAVFAIVYHPVDGQGDNQVNRAIHALMMILVLLLSFGFARFALRRGIVRPAVLAGAIGYAVSVCAEIGAATINGFIVPDLAAGGIADPDIYSLAREANQTLAALGVYAGGSALVFWGLDLAWHGSWRDRATSLPGLSLGLISVLLLATGVVQMDVAGALLLYTMGAAWAVLIALHLWAARQSA